MKKAHPVTKMSHSHGNHITFQGTNNPREQRAIAALLKRPHWRKEIDSVAGCSNGPDLIARIKNRGLDIRCLRETVIDRDGRKCRSGIYYLAPAAIRHVRNWLKRRGEQS